MSNGAHLERLNYFNGQRLEAADLRLEQAYHITVRRLLNQALFAPGVAAGLEVAVKPEDPHTVVVSHGVALDEAGREIILLREREVPVVGVPSEVEGIIYGNYLVIEYADEPVAAVQDGCAVPGGGSVCTSPAWGGPMRLRSEPRLRWQDTLPRPGSGQVTLVQAELGPDCKVRRLNLNVRRSVGLIQSRRTMAYALEGEKDIDNANPKDIYFHIRGHSPQSVILFLRSRPLSTLYYTELGAHTHADTITAAAVIAHKHPLGQITLGFPNKRHTHRVTADTEHYAPEDNGITTFHMNATGQDLTTRTRMSLSMDADQDHTHSVTAGQFTGDGGDHTPSLTRIARAAGAADQPATSATSLKLVRGLQVSFDNPNNNITGLITAQLRDRDGADTWPELGTGGVGTDELATKGTGEIDLLRLGVDLSPGEHYIRLSIPASAAGQPPNGGRISYNLYIE